MDPWRRIGSHLPPACLHNLGICQVHDNRVFAPVFFPSKYLVAIGRVAKGLGEGLQSILVLLKWLIILSGQLWPSFDWQNSSCWHSATDAELYYCNSFTRSPNPIILIRIIINAISELIISCFFCLPMLLEGDTFLRKCVWTSRRVQGFIRFLAKLSMHKENYLK